LTFNGREGSSPSIPIKIEVSLVFHVDVSSDDSVHKSTHLFIGLNQ
jgi:hypothetical protein